MAVATQPSSGLASAPRWRFPVRVVIRYVALIGLGIIFAMPFIWMVSVSLKPDTDLNTIPPNLIPSSFAWVNYPNAMFQPLIWFPRFFLNTLIYVGLAVIGEAVVSAIVGYGFARIPFKGSSFLFAIVLSTMMLPSQITLIPQYLIFRDLGWLDSLKPLIIPAWFGGAFYIFLFRQFFMTIPREVDDAAFIDGASHLDILFRIMIPLSIPVVVTCLALSIVSRWNDFFGPLIYVNSLDKTVMAVGLTFFNVPGQPSPENLLMAASVVTALPVIVLFLFLQDYFVQGVTLTGLREG
ncbi:MAG: carbohydrate ABC transporter permease [Chloroflexota bacterium]